MNKRILKLFTQACYHGNYEPENVPNEVVEKFAELIVKECAGLFPAEYDNVKDKTTIGNIIKEHFGVEE